MIPDDKNIHASAIIKFRYSDKATKFTGISTIVLRVLSNVKTMMEISSNFVAFSKNLNFITYNNASKISRPDGARILSVSESFAVETLRHQKFMDCPLQIRHSGINRMCSHTRGTFIPLICRKKMLKIRQIVMS